MDTSLPENLHINTMNCKHNSVRFPISGFGPCIANVNGKKITPLQSDQMHKYCFKCF